MDLHFWDCSEGWLDDLGFSVLNRFSHIRVMGG